MLPAIRPLRLLRLFSLPLLSVALWANSPSPAAPASLWPAIEPATITRRLPQLQPDADAECLLAQTFLEDRKAGRKNQRRITYLLRTKLYTQRAVQQHGNVELAYNLAAPETIEGVAARTILPSGRIIELPQESLLATVVRKTKIDDIRAIRFAFPALEPGAIIEYRYTRVLLGPLPAATRHVWQKEMPVLRSELHLKPRREAKAPFRVYAFQTENPRGTVDAEGYQTLVVERLPAFVEEPYAPAADQLRPWLLLQYEDARFTPENFARAKHAEFAKLTQPSAAVRAMALRLTAGLEGQEAKLARLADFCRQDIRNLAHQAEDFPQDDTLEPKARQRPEQTLARRAGTMRDINHLFAALAQSLGYTARWVMASSATGAAHRDEIAGDALLPNSLVAVQTVDNPEQWQFFNPGIPYLPSGQVDWDEEGQPAMLCLPEGARFVRLPYSDYRRNAIHRKATVRLDPAGRLVGEATEEYTGQYANSQKRYYENITQDMRLDELRGILAERFAKAKIEKLQLGSAAKALGNVTLRYELDKPNFAQPTSKRITLPASLFEFAATPMFSASSRTHPVQYRNQYLETDEILVELPAGFRPEHLPPPTEVRYSRESFYQLTITFLPATQQLRVVRRLQWQDLTIPAVSYARLRAFWQQVVQADQEQVLLRRDATVTPVSE